MKKTPAVGLLGLDCVPVHLRLDFDDSVEELLYDVVALLVELGLDVLELLLRLLLNLRLCAGLGAFVLDREGRGVIGDDCVKC